MDLTSYRFTPSTESHEGIKEYIDEECAGEIDSIYNSNNGEMWMSEQEFKCRLIQSHLTQKIPPIMRAMWPNDYSLFDTMMRGSSERIRGRARVQDTAGPEVASSSSAAPPSGAAQSRSRGRSQRGRGRGR